MSSPGSEFKALVRLAVPLALAQAGTQIMSVVDLAVLGRVGARELGAAGLGNAIFFMAAVVGIGLVMGVDPMISQALGAGDEVRARHVFWQGVWVSLITTVLLTIPLLASPLLLPAFGVDPSVRKLTAEFVLVRTAGLAPLLLFLVARAYLQAHHITRPMIVAMLVGNVFNFLSDLLLVFGGASLPWWCGPMRLVPAMGVAGAALSTDLGSLLQLWIIVTAVRKISVPAHALPSIHRPHRDEMTRAIRIGTPLGIQMGAELGIFTLVGLLAGSLGALELAAHQLVLSLASFTYTLSLGISMAASVRVGLAVGARNRAATRAAGFVAIAGGMAWMSFAATVFALIPRAVARVISNQQAVITAAVPLFFVAALFQIADGVQAVASGALRGAGDTRFSLLANIFGYWLIGFPVAYYLGLHRSMGIVGLWWGLCAGLVSVAILLFIRFDRLSSREIVPIAHRSEREASF